MQRSSVGVHFNFEELQVFSMFCFRMGKNDHRDFDEQIAVATHETRMAFQPWNSEAEPFTSTTIADFEAVLAFAAETFGDAG